MDLRLDMRFFRQLADLCGIQMAYHDAFHHRRRASMEALLATLRALGAPILSPDDITSAWRERRQSLWQRPLEPVVVSWECKPSLMAIRLPANLTDRHLNYHLILENGERKHGEWRGTDSPIIETAEVEGILYLVRQFPLPGQLPWGYHQLTLELPGKSEETLIISAPIKAYTPPEELENRRWGFFLPLYALQTDRSWGGGDFSDLKVFMAWAAGNGARVLATLPLLARFFDDVSGASPYNPVSRLMWNEFYVDVRSVPEMQDCPAAQELVAASSFQNQIRALRDSNLVDYRQQMTLKRQVLEEMCRCLFANASHRLEALHRFAEANPVVENYARFRATCEKLVTPWQSWPQSLQEGTLNEGDYNEQARRYHLYVQWLANQQIQALSENAKGTNLQLCFDLPLGVHPNGYDVWSNRDLFIPNLSAGAPPDTVFTKGQNWEFPPLHPEKIREQGYGYTIAYLRHHLQHAGILRIDHVMGLHRLFCIPAGMEASEGTYIRYRHEELYAILALESHRNQTILVGEDLGTVPMYVRPEMARHKLHRMYVMQYELASDCTTTFPPVPRNAVASLNTHDMYPFTAFWHDLDIEERLALGLLDKRGAESERKTRRKTKRAIVSFLQNRGLLKSPDTDVMVVLRACLAFLSSSRARIVLVNLEDLWLETQPQNVPGTHEEHPNWRRKARYSFEAFCHLADVNDILREIGYLRKKREK